MSEQIEETGARNSVVIAVDTYRIAYMALPKAACTTVKSLLARVDPEVDLPPPEAFDVDLWHRIYPTMRFRPHRWEQYRDYWRFCIVRDPFKRLMSCYADRVVERQELRNSRKIRRGDFDLPVDPDPDFFFQNLDSYKRAASAIKHHTLPARLFLGPTLDHYDRVYRTEEIGELAEDLASRTGRTLDVKRENSTAMKLGISDLSPLTRDGLRARLDPDYELLKDFYENPLA